MEVLHSSRLYMALLLTVSIKSWINKKSNAFRLHHLTWVFNLSQQTQQLFPICANCKTSCGLCDLVSRPFWGVSRYFWRRYVSGMLRPISSGGRGQVRVTHRPHDSPLRVSHSADERETMMAETKSGEKGKEIKTPALKPRQTGSIHIPQCNAVATTFTPMRVQSPIS